MICIPIMASNTEEALRKMTRAAPLAELLEIRLDVMGGFHLPAIVSAAAKPVLVTYRSKREGGFGTASHEAQARYLSKAVEAGAHFVDVEFSMPPELRRDILGNRGQSRIIVSAHYPTGTPSAEELAVALTNMVATGADVVKIVTRGSEPTDNLRVMSLLEMARDLRIPMIAFCMGSVGRISRIASLLCGAYLTFASLEEGEESADGQIPAREMRRLLNGLK